MKHPDTGKWIPAVIYHRYGNPYRLWCRSVENFKSHFSDAKVEGDEYIYEKVNTILFT